MLNARSTCLQAFARSLSAVKSSKLVHESVVFSESKLIVCGKEYALTGRLVVVAFGKASLGMMRALLDILGGRIEVAICIMPEPKESDEIDKTKIPLMESGRIHLFHGSRENLPNDHVLRASNMVYQVTSSLNAQDLLLVCISGGGSALLTLPKVLQGERIKLEDLLGVTKLLSQVGADICQLNTVRSCFDELKAGGLARIAHPAQVVSLIISDVIDDPLRYIASGPTVTNNNWSPMEQKTQSMRILQRLGLMDKIPKSLLTFLNTQSEEGQSTSTPENSHVDNWIIGNNAVALKAAEAFLKSLDPYLHSCTITRRFSGDAEEQGSNFAQFVWKIVQQIMSPARDPVARLSSFASEVEKELEKLVPQCSALPKLLLTLTNTSSLRRNSICLLLGGETTVKVKTCGGTNGTGGRCSHFALAAAIRWFELTQHDDLMLKANSKLEVVLLVGATDGLDGPAAAGGGALINLLPKSLINSPESYQEALHYLRRFDSYGFLRKYHPESIIQSKLTDVNVMDLIMLMISIE